MDETSLAAAPVPEYDLDDPALYQNRELSWLDFNDRVFAEVLDMRNPLLERVKFLAITASNLEEFYGKRIGWLKRLMRTDPRMKTVDGLTVAEQLDAVMRRCTDLHARMDNAWCEYLEPELRTHGIEIVAFRDLDEATRSRISGYFEQAIYPVLTPLVVDPAHPFPFISSGSLSLAMDIRDPRSGLARFARVKVPQNRPRFLDAGASRFVRIEDVIAAHAYQLFPGMDLVRWELVRVVRSAETGAPGEEADDLLEVIENQVRRRRLAEAVHLEISSGLPRDRRELLLEELALTEDDIYESGGLIGVADLMQLAGLERTDLRDAPYTPAVPSVFVTAADGAGLFAAIKQRDILVHHPYESFDATVARFVDEAAEDPAVLAIKQTMYRTSPDSPILVSLIEASGRGKQVAVLVELTARFDEANNIDWARKLEDAGVHVAYGSPALKIHSKISLVVREEPGGVTTYAHISTGNYNSRTARVYTDLGLFTADRGICADLVTVFNALTGYADAVHARELLVAPASVRPELQWRLEREIEAARKGKPARVVFKMNALEDREFTRLLYEASAAGVQVDLIIRGICRMRAGLPGLSETARVRSVIGRYLEHSRVYRFENGGDPEYFIGSADLMKRNLDERIEVLTPVRQPDLKMRLEELLELQLADERQGWVLTDSTWGRDPTVRTAGTHEILAGRAPFS